MVGPLETSQRVELDISIAKLGDEGSGWESNATQLNSWRSGVGRIGKQVA